MQLTRISMGLVLTMSLTHAAAAQHVTADYTSGTDFQQYRTFMWIMQPAAKNPLVKQRIVEEVNAALTTKGLTLVTSNGDLAIAAHAATSERRTLQTFYDGFGGGWRWNGGFGSATTTVSTFEEGSIVIDIFDGRTRAAVWRGTSTKTLSGNPEKNAQSLNKAIAKMFKNFPPPAARPR